MLRKTLVGAMLAACLMLTPLLTRGTTVTSGDIGITVQVDQFAEWATAPTIAKTDWGHINTVNQTRTVTKNVTLYSNLNVTVKATTSSGSPDYDGILTNGSNTLGTKYSITGAEITPTNPGLLTPTAFFDSGNTYALGHTAGKGDYTLVLTVTAASVASAPDSGDYTCGLQLTATW